MSFHCLLDNVQSGEMLEDVSQWETAVANVAFALHMWRMGAKRASSKEEAQEKLEKVFVLMELSGRLDLMARNEFRFLSRGNSVWSAKEKYQALPSGDVALRLCEKYQLGDFAKLFREHLKRVGL